MGYLICEECGGYYKLQPGEYLEDFDRCQCGGRLKYEEYISYDQPNPQNMPNISIYILAFLPILLSIYMATNHASSSINEIITLLIILGSLTLIIIINNKKPVHGTDTRDPKTGPSSYTPLKSFKNEFWMIIIGICIAITFISLVPNSTLNAYGLHPGPLTTILVILVITPIITLLLKYTYNKPTNYLICNKCGSQYEIPPGEYPDFNKCHCEGQLEYEGTPNYKSFFLSFILPITVAILLLKYIVPNNISPQYKYLLLALIAILLSLIARLRGKSRYWPKLYSDGGGSNGGDMFGGGGDG